MTEDDCPTAWTNRILVLNVAYGLPGDNIFLSRPKMTPFSPRMRGNRGIFFWKSWKRLFLGKFWVPGEEIRILGFCCVLSYPASLRFICWRVPPFILDDCGYVIWKKNSTNINTFVGWQFEKSGLTLGVLMPPRGRKNGSTWRQHKRPQSSHSSCSVIYTR